MNQHVKSVSSEEDSEQIVFVIDDDESMRVALTVKIHRGHMMKKMEARSLADLVRMAEMLGIKRTTSYFTCKS